MGQSPVRGGLLLPGFLAALLGACDGPFAASAQERDVAPGGVAITVADTTGMSWDGDFGPIPALAEDFAFNDAPPGVDPAVRNRFTFEGAPDPFLEIWLDGRLVFTSTVEPDNFYPSWPSTSGVRLALFEDSEVRLRVWDRDDGHAQLVGERVLGGGALLGDSPVLELDLGQARGLTLLVSTPILY